MNLFFHQILINTFLILCVVGGLSGCVAPSKNIAQQKQIYIWETQEIVLFAQKQYSNYYTDVDMWVQLKGPGFDKRVYGFWDGENRYVVRVVATGPGEWTWRSGSNSDDAGLNDRSGGFTAIKWSAREKQENPNRRGFVRVSPNGHALEYADGTPFFMVGDTWLAGTTWRLPFRNASSSSDYQPGPGVGFEDAVAYRKNQGFNSVSMISSFPNWDADLNPSTHADKNGIYLRNAWVKVWL
jgi:hypothetical protein